MRVEETPGRLVVRDNPWPFWAFYGAFPLMGLAALYLPWAKAPDVAVITHTIEKNIE